MKRDRKRHTHELKMKEKETREKSGLVTEREALR